MDTRTRGRVVIAVVLLLVLVVAVVNTVAIVLRAFPVWCHSIWGAT